MRWWLYLTAGLLMLGAALYGMLWLTGPHALPRAPARAKQVLLERERGPLYFADGHILLAPGHNTSGETAKFATGGSQDGC